MLIHVHFEENKHGGATVRYARCLSSETMKYSHFKSKVRDSGSSYREKIKRTKTSDIRLLEYFPVQIVTSLKIFKPYCIIHTS